MKCSKCGAIFSSAYCPTCGNKRPDIEPLSLETKKNIRRNPTGVWAFVISLLTFITAYSARLHDEHLSNIIFLVISIILTILAFKKAKEYNLKRGLTITSLVLCCISAILLLPILINDLNESNQGIKPSETRRTALITTQAPTSTPTIPPLTADELKNLCEEIPYKDILRNPDDFNGRYITITLKISQVIKSGWVDGRTYYRCYSDNDGYDFYFDDEYYVADYRSNGSLKLLDGDIITVYGQVLGSEELIRALTGTSDEIVSIAMIYCDLIAE